MPSRKTPNTKKTMASVLVLTFLKFCQKILIEGKVQEEARNFILYYKISKDTNLNTVIYAFCYHIFFNHKELVCCIKDNKDFRIFALLDEFKYFTSMTEKRITEILAKHEEAKKALKEKGIEQGYEETCLDWLLLE